MIFARDDTKSLRYNAEKKRIRKKRKGRMDRATKGNAVLVMGAI